MADDGGQKEPAGHCTAVADVDADGQKYPDMHGPLHVSCVRAAEAPKYPAAQSVHV